MSYSSITLFQVYNDRQSGNFIDHTWACARVASQESYFEVRPLVAFILILNVASQ